MRDAGDSEAWNSVNFKKGLAVVCFGKNLQKVFSAFNLLLILGILLNACGGGSSTPATESAYGADAAGTIPSQLDNKMLIGLYANVTDQYNWMAASGVPWNARYLYLSLGWVDNWGWGQPTGDYAFNYMKGAETINALPVLEFYLLNNIGSGGTNGLYTKTTDPATMQDYFGQFKVLLTRAKEFGKPVLILIEADGFAFLQLQTSNDPTAYAAVADSGVPELTGLPNTVAGWGLAFLELKKQLGADNVVLGMHVSAWASGKDLSYSSATIPLEPEVDKVYNFLAPLGLTPNQTGLEYDLLVGDPLDRDSDYYRIQFGYDRWWDASDAASINSKSFNRYAEWLRQWNVKADKRWVLWQIALGNQYSANVPYSGNARDGYKDNRVEYFLGANSRTHLAKFADSGVIGLLFGRGASDQANYLHDEDADGNSYIKAQAAAFYQQGGMLLQR